MNRILAVAFIVIGGILLVLGIQASDSVASEFSELFKGRPSNEAVWFLLGGALLLVVGLGAMLVRPRRMA